MRQPGVIFGKTGVRGQGRSDWHIGGGSLSVADVRDEVEDTALLVTGEVFGHDRRTLNSQCRGGVCLIPPSRRKEGTGMGHPQCLALGEFSKAKRVGTRRYQFRS